MSQRMERETQHIFFSVDLNQHVLNLIVDSFGPSNMSFVDQRSKELSRFAAMKWFGVLLATSLVSTGCEL